MPGGFPSLDIQSSPNPDGRTSKEKGINRREFRSCLRRSLLLLLNPHRRPVLRCVSLCVEFLNSSVPGVTHPSRLNRDLQNRFGSSAYAMEELRAELASAFVANERKRVVFPSGSLVRGAVAGSRLHHRIFDEFCDARRQTMRVHKRHPQCKRGPFRQGWRECAKRRRSRFILKVLPALRLIDQLQV